MGAGTSCGWALSGLLAAQVAFSGLAPPPLGLDVYLPAPADNPITADKLALVERLFAEERLSGDGRTSWRPCHQPQRAFTDGRRLPRGVFGREGRRNVPSIHNRGYGTSF